jgi:hypothetical protein
MKAILLFILGGSFICTASASRKTLEIEASLIRGSYTESYTYSIGTNMMRIARNETNRPFATDLVDPDTGAITLIYPHNRSFMRLKPPQKANAAPAGFPDMPMPPGGFPSGIGPQPGSSGSMGVPATPAQMEPINLPGAASMPDMPAAPSAPAGTAHPGQPGPMNLPGMPNLPNMPADMGAGMPMSGMMPGAEGGAEGELPGAMSEPSRRRSSRTLQFSVTGETTNLLGYACTRYELRQRGRVMEIWATDQLPAFQPWIQNPPSRHHGPQMMEESWGDLLQARNLFPMRIEMKNESGETLPFEFTVESVAPKQFGAGKAQLFQPPVDYHELEPPPF